MALQDLAQYMIDPDFVDEVTLIRRTPQEISDKGRSSFVETASQVYMCVQGRGTEKLNRTSDSAWLTDAMDFYYAGTLYAASPGGYADVIVWKGRRYQVEEVPEDFSNYGSGWTHAIGRLEAVNNGY
jgi:hypothetical protein